MTNEQILRWLLEWGMNEVHAATLSESWATNIPWSINAYNGVLERHTGASSVTYKLTPKALEQIK
jgi:hypothetical protein